MAEETQAQVPQSGAQQANTGAPPPAASGVKLVKIAAAVLAVLFVLLAGTAFYIYRRVEQTKAALEEAFRASPPPFPGLPSQPGTPPGNGFGLATANSQQSSGLNLISGSLPGGAPAFSAEQGERVHNALMKYENRPIVKEFMADLKKNPDMARALEQSKNVNNPLAVLSTIQNAKGMEKLMAKYVYRPEFLSLMMEVMKDPDIKPLMGNMAGALPGGLPGGAMPAQPPAAEPAQSLPSVSGGEEDAPVMLDPSAISGSPAEPAARPRSNKAPPPIDNE
ncbi:MAG: hypothetical protein NDI60_11375 [Elusimicrobiales bacterium]|nr:hypothetical protein [Elusimicrobiales bacterium]